MVVAHSGDQGEIVGRLPPVTALGLPPALGAMGDGYRLGGRPFLHGSAQTASRASGVRRDVGQTPAMLETVAGDDGEELRGYSCLLYTSPSPRDRQKPRMPSSA